MLLCLGYHFVLIVDIDDLLEVLGAFARLEQSPLCTGAYLAAMVVAS